jgi:hypothetical protein
VISDLAALLAIGGLLGLAMVIGVVVVALRRRDHRRREDAREGEDRAIDESR